MHYSDSFITLSSFRSTRRDRFIPSSKMASVWQPSKLKELIAKYTAQRKSGAIAAQISLARELLDSYELDRPIENVG